MSITEAKEHSIVQQGQNLHPVIEKAVKVSTLHIIISIAIKGVLTLLFLIFFAKVISAISYDIKMEQKEEKEEFEKEIQNCKNDYYLNKCDTGENFHIPGLREECARLKTCMETPAKATPSTEIAIRFIAKSIDSFYSHLTTQTTIKIGITIAVVLFVWKIVT